jgi:hypothetical protein
MGYSLALFQHSSEAAIKPTKNLSHNSKHFRFQRLITTWTMHEYSTRERNRHEIFQVLPITYSCRSWKYASFVRYYILATWKNMVFMRQQFIFRLMAITNKAVEFGNEIQRTYYGYSIVFRWTVKIWQHCKTWGFIRQFLSVSVNHTVVW